MNHTVEAEAGAEVDPRADDVEIGEMKSKPNFTVDIVRGNQTLGFTCSFNSQPGASGADDSYSKYYIYMYFLYILALINVLCISTL